MQGYLSPKSLNFGFARQTIYNELKIGMYMHTVDYRDVPRYSPEKAQQKHEYAQSGKGRTEKIGKDQKYADYLEKKIVDERFSPAAALAAARNDPEVKFTTNICVTTLYSYIEKGLFRRLNKEHLWNKSKEKKDSKKTNRRIAHPKLPSISDRPKEIDNRDEYGHWEMDLVVGKKETKPVLMTLTERKYREEIIIKLPDKKAASVRMAFDKMETEMENFSEVFKSITTDNGSEFLEYDRLIKSVKGEGTRFKIWYCHSFSAWEKGSNENHNRMIRRFFPKGTDFTEITEEEIQKVQVWMNNYPRKILGWKTPEEMKATG